MARWELYFLFILCLYCINPLNAELNPIRHLLTLVGARHIVHVSRIRVKITPNPPNFRIYAQDNSGPCFSYYYYSRHPKRATELIQESLPVHNKTNIKSNPTVRLSFMYITSKKSTANLKLTAGLIVPPDTPTVIGALCWLTWPQDQEASGLKQRLTACVMSVTGMISVECRHTSFNSYTHI